MWSKLWSSLAKWREARWQPLHATIRQLRKSTKNKSSHDIQAVAVTRTSVSVTDAKVTPSEAKQASPGSLGKHATMVPHCASEGWRGRTRKRTRRASFSVPCLFSPFHLSTNRRRLFHTSGGMPRQRSTGDTIHHRSPTSPCLTHNERAAASPHKWRLMPSVFDDVHRGLLHFHTATQYISATRSHYGNAAPEGRQTERARGGRRRGGGGEVGQCTRRWGPRWSFVGKSGSDNSLNAGCRRWKWNHATPWFTKSFLWVCGFCFN